MMALPDRPGNRRGTGGATASTTSSTTRTRVCRIFVRAGAGPRRRGGRRTELDLVSLDEYSPRLLGLRLPRAGLGFLVLGVLLSATAVASAGTIGFVGLVAPHAARRAPSWAGST
jgi:hypothetical protein